MPYLYSETCHRVSMLVGDASLELPKQCRRSSRFPIFHTKDIAYCF